MNMKTKQPKMYARNDKGFSLLELLLVLVVISFLTILVFELFNSTSDQADASALNGQTQQIYGAVESINPGPDYTNIGEDVLIRTQKLPDSMINGNTLRNAQGGSIVVAPASVNGGTNNAYAVTFDQISTSVCNSVIRPWVGVFLMISINGTTVKDAANPNPSEAAIATACDNPTNTVTYTAI